VNQFDGDEFTGTQLQDGLIIALYYSYSRVTGVVK